MKSVRKLLLAGAMLGLVFGFNTVELRASGYCEYDFDWDWSGPHPTFLVGCYAYEEWDPGICDELEETCDVACFLADYIIGDVTDCVQWPEPYAEGTCTCHG